MSRALSFGPQRLCRAILRMVCWHAFVRTCAMLQHTLLDIVQLLCMLGVVVYTRPLVIPVEALPSPTPPGTYALWGAFLLRMVKLEPFGCALGHHR